MHTIILEEGSFFKDTLTCIHCHLNIHSEVLFKQCILRLYLHNLPVQTPRRVSEVEEAMVAGVMTPPDRRGTAQGCFMLARCLQLGQAVSRNEQKADEYFTKVRAQSALYH